MGRRFGRDDRSIHGFAGYHWFGFAGKKRGYVAVLAHAEENKVKHRLAVTVERRNPADFCFRLGGSDIRRLLAMDSMNLILGNGEGGERGVNKSSRATA